MLYGLVWGEKLWTTIPSVAIAGQFLQTFWKAPIQPGVRMLNIERALRMIEAGQSRWRQLTKWAWWDAESRHEERLT